MNRFRIRVLGDGAPLPGVRISREVGRTWELVGLTDLDGYQSWEVDPSILPLKLLFEARSGFWTKHQAFREAAGDAVVHLEPLPRKGPIAWWHRSLGPSAGRSDAGRGFRIGILDTGVGPCACLDHVSAGGAWLEGDFYPGEEASRDIASHGTHVTGLISARACHELDYVGMAPGVMAVVARVFSETSGRTSHDDVANGIEALVREHGVHLINLSLGGSQPADIEREAIFDALDSGTLVLAASGNKNGPVEFPAAYDEVVAVSALGKFGEGSELARAEAFVAKGEPFNESAGFYPADFSCHGQEITCVAPGVDIISTVPSSIGDPCEFAATSGTSMATPIACAVLAILLARDRLYLEMEPTRKRAKYALQVLLGSCRDLGFSKERQGAGLPTVP